MVLEIVKILGAALAIAYGLIAISYAREEKYRLVAIFAGLAALSWALVAI
ncbi:MAG: hypothetical protein QME61_01885 [Patescibacteria group bacterium]|nr:hypothetical protein [Patescibacteria group bacterium]